VKRAYLLANPGAGLGAMVEESGGVIVNVPATAPNSNATVVVLEIAGQPQVTATTVPIMQSADGTLTLKAADAEIIGNTAKLENKSGDVPNIGFWSNPKDRVEWTAEITKPGVFEVELNYACAPNCGGQYTVSANNQKFTANVTATQGWADFATAKVGQLNVEKAATVTVSIQPVKRQGEGLMNLRSLKLKPVK
jgi:alpha-L-fucosidase